MRAGVRPAYLSNRLKRGYTVQLRRRNSCKDTDSVWKYVGPCVRWDHEGAVLHAIFQLVLMSHYLLEEFRHLECQNRGIGNHKKAMSRLA
jgi:hypothetical protein